MRLLAALSFVFLHVQPFIYLTEANSPRPVVLPEDGCNYDKNFILPVCSNNSYTYGSKYQLECESQARVKRGESPIVVKYTGVCDHEGCICPAGIFPVCGTDGKTYENECRMFCNSAREVRLGLGPINVHSREECPSTCNKHCPIDFIPSCGSDGVTYSSVCAINCKNIERARIGLPPILRTPGACPQSCICPQVIQRVCGSDGVTYTNECELVCESERRRRQHLPPITVRGPGWCPLKPCICPLYVLPVCGTNGKTYNNECELICASKKQESNSGPPIRVYHNGRCNPPPCPCPPIVQLVCGTDRKTYWNVCYLNCATFYYLHNGWPAVFLKSIGSC